jgi:hypothetical protein
MKYVPAYLLPKGVTTANPTTVVNPESGQENKFDAAIASGVIGNEIDGTRGFVPFHKRVQGRGRGRGRGVGSKHGTKRKSNPLRKFGA